MRYNEPCGCRHNGIEWLAMCEAHRAETDAISARWKAERQRGVEVTHTSYHGQAKPPELLKIGPDDSRRHIECPSSKSLESTDWLDVT